MLQTLLILVTLIIGTIGVFRPEKRKKLWRITIISLLVLSAIIQTRIAIIARQKNQELEGIRDYTDISKLDQSGKPFVVGGGIKYSTGISRIMEGTYKEHDGIVYFECDDESLKRYKRAIQEYPRFPFSYVAIAHCLMRDGDNNWREYASKAISIFEITTRIGGHDKSHELAMEQLLRLLNE